MQRVLMDDGLLLVIEPWPTIFLSVSHPLCRSRIIRALSPTIDALATMILSIARLTNLPVPLILIRRELLQCAGSFRLELFLLRTRLQSWSWEQDLPGCAAQPKYSYNHVPAHIQYFSKESMRRMAEKAGCTLCYWDNGANDGQAFQAWLE
jgi:hypothetical protein